MNVSKKDDNTYHLTVDREELYLLYTGLTNRIYELQQHQKALEKYVDSYPPIIEKAKAMHRQIIHSL